MHNAWHTPGPHVVHTKTTGITVPKPVPHDALPSAGPRSRLRHSPFP